jgi:phospho-N-acetylmuramoyl-pentapeptide-transferase
MISTSNAVNLTDGADGLAAGATAVSSLTLAAMALALGYPDVAVFAASVGGACLGFVWFNAHPAAVIMGDTGSLALGGALAATALLTRTPLLLVVVGGLYVIITLSVIIQVTYFRLTGGRRIFKMSPLHHHFELSGWSEPQVVIRFWLLALGFAALGLLAL